MRAYGLDHSFAEYVADSTVHILGVAAALIGATALLVWAAFSAPPDALPPLVAYVIGLIATFSFSAAYNMTLHQPTRAVLRRFDHAAIFVMIAGTYTPLAFIGIGGAAGFRLAAAAWAIAVLGIILKLVFFHRFYRAVFLLYLIQGWLAVAAVLPMIRTLSPHVLGLILGGGILFTLGTIFHKHDNWPYNRAIWHGFVLVAAAMHYLAILAMVSAA